MKWFFSPFMLMALTACSAAPSEGSIQTAIAQTSVAKRAVQVTSEPTVSDATSGVVISRTPAALALATETLVASVMAQSDSSGSLSVSDLPSIVLQPNDVSDFKLPLDKSESYHEPRTALSVFNFLSPQGMGTCQSCQSWDAQASEGRHYTKGGTMHIDSYAVLFKDQAGAGAAFRALSEIFSGNMKAYGPADTVETTGLGDESVGLFASDEYMYFWRSKNVVLLLSARLYSQESSVRALADKMQSRIQAH